MGWVGPIHHLITLQGSRINGKEYPTPLPVVDQFTLKIGHKVYDIPKRKERGAIIRRSVPANFSLPTQSLFGQQEKQITPTQGSSTSTLTSFSGTIIPNMLYFETETVNAFRFALSSPEHSHIAGRQSLSPIYGDSQHHRCGVMFFPSHVFGPGLDEAAPDTY
jgi:hypothetical protein